MQLVPGEHPHLVPLLLLATALAATAWPVVRQRLGWPGHRVVRPACLVLAGLALLTGAGVLSQHARLFRGVRWDGQVLVLDRMAPLADVRIARADLDDLGEIRDTQRTWSGPRPTVQFVIWTRAGRTYASAPVPTARAESVRRALTGRP